MTRVLALVCTLALLPATSSAQVRVSARTEKERYLKGEPIVAIVTLTNGGPSGLRDGTFCSDDAVTLTVLGVTRRQGPDLTFCPSPSSSFTCSGTSHPATLPPGESRDFRYLLDHYDLGAGRYQLELSGRLPWGPAIGQGTPVSQQLSFELVDASSDQLRQALQPLIVEALGPSSPARFRAREALAEAAPPFLVKELATFAREQTPTAIDALRRIGSAESHAELRRLAGELTEEQHVEWALKSLALLRDPADIPAIAAASGSLRTRQAAAEALGWIGGDEAVRHLESAMAGASEELQDSIVLALGNTRSRLAGPVLISRFSGRLETSVCSSLRVLTHRRFCEDLGLDPAAARRRMLREWQASPAMPIYGPEDCAALEEEEKQYSLEQKRLEEAARAKLAAEVPPRPWPGPAQITSIKPSEPLANAPLHIEGYGIAVEDMTRVRVRFRNGATVHEAAAPGSGRSIKDGVEGRGYLSLTTPPLTAGTWQLEIVRDGSVVANRAVIVASPPGLKLVPLQQSRLHPSQPLFIFATSVLATDRLELIDSKGKAWPLTEGASGVDVFLALIPEQVAEGRAAITGYRKTGDGQVASQPLLVEITSAPLPLTTDVLRSMTVVAGGTTTLTPGAEDEFEISRADRVEIEFQQGQQRIVVEMTGPDRQQLTIPASLAPGDALARSRTWIDRTASEWSAPVRVRILKQPGR